MSRKGSNTCPNCGAPIKKIGCFLRGIKLLEVYCKRCRWGAVPQEFVPMWRPSRPGVKSVAVRCPEHSDLAVTDGLGRWICPTCKVTIGEEHRSIGYGR